MTRSFTILASLLALTLIALTSSDASAQGWLKKATGGKISTPKPIKDIAPNGISIKRPQEQGSYLAVITHYIRNDGMVIYGSNSGNVGATGRFARVERNSDGKAYFVESGASNSPLRAPQHDIAVKKSFQQQIDPNSGVVYQLTIVNGNVTQRQQVTRLSPQYNNQGRPYYQYGNQTVWANNLAWRQPQQPQYPQNPNNGQQFIGGGQQTDPGAAIAIGILQAINQAVQNGQRP